MEISWKWLNLFLALLLVGFCKGFPLNLEDTNTGHAQFLTGVAAILITVGSVVLAGCLCCQRRKGFEEFHNSPVVASTAVTVEHGHVNPIANGEFTIFTPLSPPNFNNNIFLANEQVIRRTSDDYVCGDIDVSPWFKDSERDFPRSKLKYIKELGQGFFGKVVEGAAQDLDPDRTWTPVVVRILDAASSARERILFLNDALFYLSSPHPNVLALKGRCLNAAPLLLLQESCSGGDLKTRLKTVGSEDNILQWCYQLTSALRHLHINGFIHPDLAARNCLLTDSLRLKLGDYGLSASKYPEDYYKGEPLIPVRWRAPESLDCTPTTIQPKKLTKEANIWSLGVVMWEICENGSQPYESLDDDEVISRVFGLEGLRLDGPSKPQMYSDYIFRLIRMCWNNAESRPKVAQIDMMLSDLLQVHKNTQDPLLNLTGDFDRRWESFKPNTIVKTDNHNVSIDMEDGMDENNISKPMSPSLNNLHGSLDNLSSITPVVPNNQIYLKGLSDTSLEAVFSESDKNVKPNLNLKTHIDFRLGPPNLCSNDKFPDSPVQNDSLTDSMIFKQQGSSESDTEEENWRRKVERGAYSEKVRLKSRSVADLMVLTHVDYSESESETPMPSIDYKLNKSFRKSNFENTSLNFSSEGNLLNIEDTFEKELKKLQVERRDSLLFVPDNKSQNNSNLSLLHELNSPTEIKPMNQIYNIFNMTIDKFGPLGVSGSKLNDIINITDETRVFSRQDSENKSDLGYATLYNSERNSDFGSVDGEHLLEDRNVIIKSEIEERLKNCELLTKNDVGISSSFKHAEVHLDGENYETFRVIDDGKLKDIILLTDEENYKEGKFKQTKQNLPDILTSLDQEHSQVNVDLLETNLLQARPNSEDDLHETAPDHNDRIESEKNTVSSHTERKSEIILSSTELEKDPNQNIEFHKHDITQVTIPKLSDLVLNNHECMQFVSDRPHSEMEVEVHDELESKESQIVPDLYSENIQSSDSVNAFLNIIENKDVTLEETKDDSIPNETLEDESKGVTSTKTEVYTESFLPEIKQSFIKGPNMLETLNSTEPISSSDLCRIAKKGNLLSVNRNDPIEIVEDSLSSVNSEFSLEPISSSGATEKSKMLDVTKNEPLEIIDPNRSSPVNNESSSEHISPSDLYRDAKKNNMLDVTTKNPIEIIQDNDIISHVYSESSSEIDLNLGAFLNAERNIALADIREIDNSDKENISETKMNSQDKIIKYPQSNLEFTTSVQDEEKSKEVLPESISETNLNTPSIQSCDLKNSVNTDLCKINDISRTPTKEEFLPKTKVAFDLSESQQETMPNSLTHTTVFTSTPFGKKPDLSLPTENVYSSLNLFGAQQDQDEHNEFSSNFGQLEQPNFESENNKLNYSLETWDNFLGKSFDSTRESNENLFDSFTSEPQSMLFLVEDCQKESNADGKNDVKDCREGTFLKEHCNDGTFITDEALTKGNGSFVKDGTFVKDSTFVVEEKNNGTFAMEEKKDGTFVMEKADESTAEDNPAGGNWESGGGWFLHPQSNNDKLSGDIEPQPGTSKGSYIGFGMDDEIMTAIRNELLEKLPHAQVKGVSHENVKEEEWNQTERNEVFLRYNVYNTPLSPIPEESSFDDNEELATGENTPKLNDSDSDWSDQVELDYPPALSSHTNDSSLRIPNHGHTPSQSSCCSNDTLFNFDDFASTNEKENNTEVEYQPETNLQDDVFEKEVNGVINVERADFTDDSDDKTVKNSDRAESETYSSSEHFLEETDLTMDDIGCHSNTDGVTEPVLLERIIPTSPEDPSTDHICIDDFLSSERNHTSSACSSLSFSIKVVAPLPSPEDKPWKSLPASLLTYDSIQKPASTIDNIDITLKIDPKIDKGILEDDNSAIVETCNDTNINIRTAPSEVKISDQEVPDINIDLCSETVPSSAKDTVTYENIPTSTACVQKDDVESSPNQAIHDENKSPTYENLDEHIANNHSFPEVAEYENVSENKDEIQQFYENDIRNEADYVNIENIDVTKNNSIGYKESHDYINSNEQHSPLIIDEHVRDDHDLFGVLTDIRFSGPIDSQLMSTSFSESNDVDEQDWDSGSDTRSSSSGEFIWKEGEHEESLKALRAAPHDVLDDIKPMEEITEETTDSDVSSSTSDEEGENLEFVPSAWDKFATPTKSALRSPEKSLDRSESKKSKGVWFKKQKYHCVYEYPREPESPVLQSQDLWKPQLDYAAFSDWEFDAESYLPPPTADSDLSPSTFTYKPKINNSRRSLYYLTSPSEIQGDGSSTSSNTDEEFIAPSSGRSLAGNNAVCSQFFPGASNWIENATPDSGLDDSTPGSMSDSPEFPENYPLCRQVLPLKKLAAQVINKNKEVDKGSKDVLGGLRHTRNKLKLDLPPSPSAFTSSKTFTVEPLQEPVVLREKPTFSTFGKSRFLVQHVDTPTDDNLHQNKNVCFDVLPYKPINIIPIMTNACQENNDVTLEPLKINFDEISAFSNKKEMFIKGEASLLDSADEDSGIESSTLERKINNVANKENIRLE